MPTVDNLDIQISASLANTNRQLDNLITKLNRVSSSISSVKARSQEMGSSLNASDFSGLNLSSTKDSLSSILVIMGKLHPAFAIAGVALNAFGSSSKKATKNTFSLASALGRFYANYFLFVRGIKAFKSIIEGTADYIEAFNYFEVSFDKIAKEWKQDFAKYGKDIGANTAKEYATSFSKRAKKSLLKLSGIQVSVGADGKGLLTETGMKNLGLNIQEITQYASQLASITNSVGQTGEVSTRTASTFTKLAGDISSLFNVDYSSVAKNLQSGLIGQSRALYKYGIDITNATLQTYAYQLGLSKAVSEMTQAEKMQLRMIAILDQSKVSWGDLANTINSPSNMIRQFKNNLKEAGMTLGQLFVPILQKVLPVVNGVTIAIKRLMTSIAAILGIKLDFDEFGKGGVDLEEDFDDLSDSLDGVAGSAKKAKAGLRGFDELKTINMPDSSSAGGGAGIGNTIDLTEEIIKATEEYEKVWQEAYDKMEQRAQKFADAMEKYFVPIETLFEDIKKGDWVAVGEDVSNIVIGIFNSFSKAISKVDWLKLGQNIGDFFVGIKWIEILASVAKAFWTAFSSALKLYIGAFDKAPIETAIATIVVAFKKLFKPLVIFLTLISPLGLMNAVLISIASAIGTLVISVSKKLSDLTISLYKKISVDEKVKSVIKNVKRYLSEFKTWFENNVTKTFLDKWEEAKEKIYEFRDLLKNAGFKIDVTIDSIKDKIKKRYEDLVNWWRSKPSLSQINFSFADLLQSIKNAWNSVKNWWKSNAKLTIPKLNLKISYKEAKNSVEKAVVKALKLKGMPSLEFYQQGGFPKSADLFWANENGVPELVGTMGGKTAVASGTEITGIRDAIYSTGKQESALMQTMVGLLQVIAEKEYGISETEIGRSAQKYARDYFNRTGNDAYSF